MKIFSLNINFGDQSLRDSIIDCRGTLKDLATCTVVMSSLNMD